MDRLEFYNSKMKLLGRSLLTIIMVGTSYFCATLPGVVPQLFGCFGVCFFGAGFIVIPVRFFRSRPEVIIDQQGIMDQRLGFGLIPWEDIAGLSVGQMYSSKFLSVEVYEPEKYVGKLNAWQRKLAAANPKLGFSAVTYWVNGTEAVDQGSMAVDRAALCRPRRR